MDKFLQAFQSRTIWTLVALFVFNGLQAVEPQVSGNVQVAINLVMTVLGAYFRVNAKV